MATPIYLRRPPQLQRSRPKTASFFSDFSDLKPSDFVVHVDHGIGQFEGLRQVIVEGATGEFMLLKYAGDAKLYVPLARLDLIQKYQSLGGVDPALDRLGTTIWEARKTRVRKSVNDMAEQAPRALRRTQNRPRPRVSDGLQLAARIRGCLRIRGNC